MKNILVLFSIIVLVGNAVRVKGQTHIILNEIDSAKTYKVTLKDGSIFIGSVLNKDSSTIVMKTNYISKLEIQKNKIGQIEVIDKSSIHNNSYWFPNPHPTRYLFSPSAFSLKAGEGYYQNTYLFLNSFNVGVTDNITIGGGFEFLTTFASGDGINPVFYLTPKVAFKVAEKFHAGVGVLYVNAGNLDNSNGNRNGLGITYAIGTYGSTDHNITGGLGWGFIKGEFSNRPIITISGMTRIAKKTAFVTENWFIPYSDNGVLKNYGVFSYGLRFFGESIAVDLALINNSDIAQAFGIGLPFIDFVVKF